MYLERTSKSKRGFRFFSPSFGLAAIKLLKNFSLIILDYIINRHILAQPNCFPFFQSGIAKSRIKGFFTGELLLAQELFLVSSDDIESKSNNEDGGAFIPLFNQFSPTKIFCLSRKRGLSPKSSIIARVVFTKHMTKDRPKLELSGWWLGQGKYGKHRST